MKKQLLGFALGFAAAVLVAVSVASFGTYRAHAQVKPVAVSVPKTWGELRATLFDNLLFEDNAGVVRLVDRSTGRLLQTWERTGS